MRTAAATSAALVAPLFANTQFLYELRLALVEARVLGGGGCAAADDFRALVFAGDCDADALFARAAYIGEINRRESVYRRLTRFNATRSMNQYITHWFYPYKGKFHPQMARALANIIGMKPGGVLLDPFCGSGTAAVEGALLGLKTVCFDISPLCALIAKVKANAVHHLPKIAVAQEANAFSKTEEIALAEGLRDPCAGFELLARLIATSDAARRRRDFARQLSENRKKMLDSVALMKQGCEAVGVQPEPAKVEVADARRLPLADESVDGVVTSPPYSIALNYVANDAHALRALGYEPAAMEDDFIGVRGRGDARFQYYDQDMRRAYAEIIRVLKPGAQAAIVLGNVTVNGREIDTVGRCEEVFIRAGFDLRDKINKIIFGLYNVMQRETILIFRKP